MAGITKNSRWQLGDYLKSINIGKSNIMEEDPEAEKGYPAYIVNRTLSYFPDTILVVNEINQYADLTNRLQYDFLLAAVRRRKRFSRWHKPDNSNTAVEDAMIKLYGYNRRRARQALELLTEEDRQDLIDRTYRGGKA